MCVCVCVCAYVFKEMPYMPVIIYKKVKKKQKALNMYSIFEYYTAFLHILYVNITYIRQLTHNITYIFPEYIKYLLKFCNTILFTVTDCKSVFWYSNTVTILRSPITNAYTIAKCNTILNGICGTKCNDKIWSYPGNGTKRDTIVLTVLLLWSYPGNGSKYVSR